ncbi:MAG: orotate phosphoribosyltransferase [Chitinophagaceae bacterium]
MTDAYVTAEKLLQVDAVRLNADTPFTWASGWKSPIYCDNRKILLYPFVRDYFKSELCNVVFKKFNATEVIAGVATAGIPWGMMIADQLKLPFIYVRPSRKAHGLENQIEGEIFPNQKLVVVEDLISTGKSSLQVINVLKDSGVEVIGAVSIFNYRFKVANEAFTDSGIELYSLTDYPALIELAGSTGLVRQEYKEILLKWREDPANWTGVN